MMTFGHPVTGDLHPFPLNGGSALLTVLWSTRFEDGSVSVTAQHPSIDDEFVTVFVVGRES